MSESTDSTGMESQTEQTSKQSILSQQISEGLDELTRPSDGLFLSSLSAGLDIGFGPLLMVAVATLVAGEWGPALTDIAKANLYSVGFIFVVLGRSELFTEHTTLAVLPVVDGQASVRQLGRLWGVVYGGNIAGSAVFAVLAVSIAPAFGIADPSKFTELAKPFVEHSAGVLLGGAILAGWLMGLLSWLVAAAQETLARTFFVWIVATTIGILHLPHSIAGNVEVLAAVLAGPTIGVADYAEFLVVATVGNAIGGTVFVSLLKYGHVVRTNG
jgi:formate/nitrite transporter FocA (FNT family)